MALPAGYRKDTTALRRTGIVVGLLPLDPNFEVELQRAPESAGAPDLGNAVIIDRLPPIPLTGLTYVDPLPVDGANRYYRCRAVRTGWTDGDWTPWTGAHLVHGAIWQSWGNALFDTGPTGYPTTDELRAEAEIPPEPAPIAKPSKIVMPKAQTPSWRQHLVAGIARHSRRG